MNEYDLRWGLVFALMASLTLTMAVWTILVDGSSIFIALLSGACLMAALVAIFYFLDGVARAIIDQAKE